MKRARGRPTGLKEGELRRRIIDAAADEFARAGYGGARIERMAEAAGCDRALLYFYFRDKPGLFRAALDEAAEYRVEQMAAQPQTLAEGLVYWFRKNLSEPRRIRLIMQEALADADDVQPPQRLSYLNDQLNVVRHFQSRGLLRADMDARHLLTVILALTSFPTCFPRVAGVALDAGDASALEASWSECLRQMAILLAPAPA